ncbi:hypothetical protein R1sor_019720 [Riccia sorocarpa]|uniref:Response regulatory domain-containing protein n=1 Tax=Riccia sorocarpa TaxID=122646 RepID=A0ABD3IDB4_9MARC
MQSFLHSFCYLRPKASSGVSEGKIEARGRVDVHCDEAENGKIAVDYYKEGRTYDLILMEKEMPVMDGHEATRQIRRMGVITPIIALTGNAMPADRELFFEAGVDDFQTKPLSRDTLVQLLSKRKRQRISSGQHSGVEIFLFTSL